MDIEVKKTTEEGFDLETCFSKEFKENKDYSHLQDYYFDSYSHFSIHEEMLQDTVRTETYERAITNNKHLFKDKIVLDIGCGTGILSIFAAQAGAKHVYGIENATIAKHAQQILKDNNLSEKITIIHGKVEEIELPVKQVDIIISEWMGYFLLYESMFDTVLYARDKWLTKDGLLFPDRAVMYLAAVEDESYKKRLYNFWDNVYGVSMRAMKQWTQTEPQVDFMDKNRIISNSCAIADLNLYEVKKEDLDFSSKYCLKINKNDNFDAIVGWFDAYFSHSHIPLVLSTSPYRKNTHWKQTIFYVQEGMKVLRDDKILGSIAVKKNDKNERELDIKLSVNLHKKDAQFPNKKVNICYFKL